MDRWAKILIFLTIIASLTSISLITTSFATDFWLIADPYLNYTNTTRYIGSVNFGLFHGYETLNYRGARLKEIWVKDYAFNEGIVNSSLWISTLALGMVALSWSLVSIAFAAFNVCGRPIETISGPAGLYLWNSLACLFTLACITVFTVHYSRDLSKNVLRREDTDIGWTSDGTAKPGYSFWLCVAACGLNLVNILLVVCSGTKFHLLRYSASSEKVLDGVMMY